jgi:hypothetical protein
VSVAYLETLVVLTSSVWQLAYARMREEMREQIRSLQDGDENAKALHEKFPEIAWETGAPTEEPEYVVIDVSDNESDGPSVVFHGRKA